MLTHITNHCYFSFLICWQESNISYFGIFIVKKYYCSQYLKNIWNLNFFVDFWLVNMEKYAFSNEFYDLFFIPGNVFVAYLHIFRFECVLRFGFIFF